MFNVKHKGIEKKIEETSKRGRKKLKTLKHCIFFYCNNLVESMHGRSISNDIKFCGIRRPFGCDLQGPQEIIICLEGEKHCFTNFRSSEKKKGKVYEFLLKIKALRNPFSPFFWCRKIKPFYEKVLPFHSLFICCRVRK